MNNSVNASLVNSYDKYTPEWSRKLNEGNESMFFAFDRY